MSHFTSELEHVSKTKRVTY